MDIVEKLFNYDKIPEEIYRKEMSKYLLKFENISKQIQGFQLEKFLKVFSY